MSRQMTDDEIKTMAMLLDASHFPGIRAYRSRNSAGRLRGVSGGPWFDDKTFDPLSEEEMSSRWRNWESSTSADGPA